MATAHATLHGTITDTGGENADERGFEWGTVSGVYPNSWTETNSYGVASFSHQITGLAESQTYYFRAKAHNSAGWGYGTEKSFDTPPPPIPPIERFRQEGRDFRETKFGATWAQKLAPNFDSMKSSPSSWKSSIIGGGGATASA